MVHLDGRRQVAAARLTPVSDELTIFYADGGRDIVEAVAVDAADKRLGELGLLLGGTSDDGVRHWWR